MQRQGGVCRGKGATFVALGSIASTSKPRLWEASICSALRCSHHTRGLPAPLAAVSSSSFCSRTPLVHPHATFAQPLAQPSRRHPQLQTLTASATAASVPSDGAPHRKRRQIGSMFDAAVAEYQRFTSLTGKFMPMVGLFFLLAFVNTIIDSLKDTLVITAVGGGAQVIPYLTVYAVLPSSLLFLLIYSTASQHLSRPTLFNGIVSIFISFFVLFAFVLYPNHQALHPHTLADSVTHFLPCGLYGLVGMVRNWTFTLFFCMSELWGDVCLGLLFWGLANDTTSLSDAHTLYPLFGLGANVAQMMAGLVLKAFSGGGSSAAAFTAQIQSLMLVVLGFSAAALGLHHYIDRQETQKAADKQRRRQQRKAEAEARQLQELRALRMQELLHEQQRTSHGQAESRGSVTQPFVAGSRLDAAASSGDDAKSTASTAPSAASAQSQVNGVLPSSESDVEQPSAKLEKVKPSVKEIFRTLACSVPIQCLATMSLAQGLCSSLMEFAWKSHIRLMYPTPGDFTAFLGDVSTWQGLVTLVLMILSPAMFARMGWKGVAGATPRLLLAGGIAFFTACMLYQFALANSAPAGGMAAATLAALVYGGALLYVFSRSAKFSLFKPAEEMVYISLNEEGRTKGKAAIDVVGSQAGKSGGSILQQLLLVVSGGAIAGSLPIMFGVYVLMANGWLKSVDRLSAHNPRYGQPDSVHPTLTNTEDDDPSAGGHGQEGGQGTGGSPGMPGSNGNGSGGSGAVQGGHVNGSTSLSMDRAEAEKGQNGINAYSGSGANSIRVVV